MTNIITSPFALFVDTKGAPLELGRIFIGEAGKDAETNQVDVFSDEAMTNVVEQPIRTVGGSPVLNGAVIEIFTPTVYSITVQNRNSGLVYSSASQGIVANGAVGSGLAPSAYLAPILPGENGGISLPNLDTATNTLTFTPNTRFYNGDIAFELLPGIDVLTVDLFFTSSVTKLIYLDMTDKSFVVRNPAVALNDQNRADWLLIATVRTDRDSVNDVGINCGYTIDEVLVSGGGEAFFLAPIIPGGARLPNLNTVDGNLQIQDGTVIFTRSGAIEVGALVLSVENGDRVFLDRTITAGPMFVTLGASVILDNDQEQNLILFATVKIGPTLSTLGINSEFTVDFDASDPGDNETWTEQMFITDGSGGTSATTATAAFERVFGIVFFSVTFENINTVGLVGNDVLQISQTTRYAPIFDVVMPAKIESIEFAENSVATLRQDGTITIDEIINDAPVNMTRVEHIQSGQSTIAISGTYRVDQDA